MIQRVTPTSAPSKYDLQQMQREAFKLALDLAEHCGNEAHTRQTIQNAYSRFNGAEIGQVITQALEFTVDGILAPIIEGTQIDPDGYRAMLSEMKQQVDAVFNE